MVVDSGKIDDQPDCGCDDPLVGWLANQVRRKRRLKFRSLDPLKPNVQT